MTHIHSFKNNQYSQHWRQGYYAALDIGSTKIICLIGKGKPNGVLQVEGYGWCQSAGIRNGTITDLRAAEAAIRHAVAEAEVMAARSIDRIIINLPCGHPTSRLFNIRYSVGRRVVDDTDIKRIFTAARKQAATKNREVVHILPVDFVIDDTDRVLDPRGYLCEVLNARVHIIDAAETSITNLKTLLARIGLRVEEIVVSPLASSFSVLDTEELVHSITLIEIGGDTTSLALFSEGHVLHTSSINIGGTHITHDIVNRLNTSTFDEAERVKTLFGSVELTTQIEQETIPVELCGNNIPHLEHISRAHLCRIILPQVERIFKQLREQLDNISYTKATNARIVITGGGSLLDSISLIAEQILGTRVLTLHGSSDSSLVPCSIRLGCPKRVSGTPRENTASFSTATGLLKWTMSTSPPFGCIKIHKTQPTNLLQKLVSVIRKDL